MKETIRIALWVGAAALGIALAAVPASRAEILARDTDGFEIRQEIVLPTDPETLYDTVTGDISGWWDHHFSQHPRKFYIEPRPGGGFYEIFDDQGNGVLHGTVTWAERGKRLRFQGPLGLAGYPIQLVVTYDFTAQEGGTRLTVTARAHGQVKEGWPEAVDSVWHHFLYEGLAPYLQAGGKKSNRS